MPFPFTVVTKAIKTRFEAAGYRRRDVVDAKELAPGILLRVGAVRAHAPGSYDVAVVVGLHHVALERLVTTLADLRYYPSSSTIGDPLVRLLPEPRRFTVWSESDVEAVAAEIVDAVERYAVPHYRPYASLEALVSAMPTYPSYPATDHADITMPAGLHLLGRNREALAWLAAAAARRASAAYITDFYGQFARNLRDLLDAPMTQG